MKLILLSIFWKGLPIVCLIAGGIGLYQLFSLRKQISSRDIAVMTRVFLWVVTIGFVGLCLFAYRGDVALSVRPQITAIEQQQEAIQQAEQEEQDRITTLHEELEAALDEAQNEQLPSFPKEKRNLVINEEWMARYREKIAELPDSDESKARYSQRFDHVEEWYFDN